jgi:hypothetical protein
MYMNSVLNGFPISTAAFSHPYEAVCEQNQAVLPKQPWPAESWELDARKSPDKSS